MSGTNQMMSEIILVIKEPVFKNKLTENIAFISSVLDRSLQKYKMVNVYGWDKDVIDKIESDYIKYLALTKTLQDFGLDLKLIPNLYIDEFWHNHMLDTEQYYQDCYKIFGKVLHHYPYYGILGEDDHKNWLYNSIICQEVWKECFGEDLYTNLENNEDSYKEYKVFYKELSQKYKDSTASRCRTQCKPQNCP